jgi:hypothetical protein
VLLEREVQLIAKPGAQIIAIGRAVRECLERGEYFREVKSIMHYSPLASAARNDAVMGRGADFDAFSKTVAMQDIVDVASEIMRENSIPLGLASETLGRLRKAMLTASRKKLAFAYSTAFTAMKGA